MAELEAIRPKTVLRGVVPEVTVTGVSVQWFGTDVVELTYKDPAGRVGQVLLYRDDEPRLEIVEAGRPWSFDGDGGLFRLVSEAHRIRLAYLFDPVLAVHTWLLEPLPHQITAVYEAMLPRHPLRFLLADDPDAGKTIMAGLLIKELLVRGDLQRCLVVCPGSLVEQWQDEFFRRFQLRFEIMTNDKARGSPHEELVPGGRPRDRPAGPAKLRRPAEIAREREDLCVRPEEGARIVGSGGGPEGLTAPGLYLLDLRATAEPAARWAKAAALMRHVFQRGKETGGAYPALVVVDEARNNAPEQQTGWLARARPSFEAIFAIASEGRKFNVGLVVSTQRPARPKKDVLSQCNTHMTFRVANVEDLAAIAGSLEAASRPLFEELAGFDTGVCLVGGRAVGMVTRVPLFSAGRQAKGGR